MEINDITYKYKKRKCAFPGCSNKFKGNQLKKYCNDPECILKRQAQYYKTRKDKLKEKLNNKHQNNLILNNIKLKGKTLTIHCAAKGINGRCRNKFYINYTQNQKIYPRYCSEHRNEYKRYRFENIKGTKNGESTITYDLFGFGEYSLFQGQEI